MGVDSRAVRLPGVPRWSVVLWDFDGTVANTALDVWISLEKSVQLFGRRFPDRFLEDSSNLSLPMQDICATFIPPLEEGEIAAFEREVARQYREVSQHENTVLYPGIAEAITGLRRAGGKSFIVTNKPRPALERVLAIKGWGQLFDGWWCVNPQGPELKSKPDLITRAIKVSKGRPSEFVMVGDSAGDIVAAHEVGVSSIGVTYGDGDTSDMLSACPDYLVSDGRELPDILFGRKLN